MKILALCLLGLVAVVSAFLPPNGGPNSGGSSSYGGDICNCKSHMNEADNEPYGCCGYSETATLSAEKTGQSDKEKEFLDSVWEEDGKPPQEKKLRRLSTVAKAIPDGTYGQGCTEACRWVRVAKVLVPFSRNGWVQVYQTRKFQQWIHVCYCANKVCNGYFWFYFHWLAKCQQVFTHSPLYVWVEHKFYDYDTWQYKVSYKLRLKWFKFPSNCCCGNPLKLFIKYGGN